MFAVSMREEDNSPNHITTEQRCYPRPEAAFPAFPGWLLPPPASSCPRTNSANDAAVRDEIDNRDALKCSKVSFATASWATVLPRRHAACGGEWSVRRLTHAPFQSATRYSS